MEQRVPTIRELRKRCIDENRVHPGIDKAVANIAVYITKILLYTPIRPMQVMVFWFLLQIVSCLIILQGTYVSILAGVLLYQLSTILDYVDGQLARIKYNRESTVALYVDQIFHWFNHPLLFLSLALAIDALFVGVVIVALFLYNRVIIFNPSIYNLKNERIEEALHKICWSRQHTKERNFFTRLGEPFRLGLLFNALFIGALFALTKWVLYIYLILFALEFGRRLLFTMSSLKSVDKELAQDGQETKSETRVQHITKRQQPAKKRGVR